MQNRSNDAVLAAVHGQLMRHALQGKLGCRVGQGIRSWRLRRDTANIDDASALRSLTLHDLDGLTAAQECRREVHVQTSCQYFSVMSSMGTWVGTPALFTRMSTRP